MRHVMSVVIAVMFIHGTAIAGDTAKETIVKYLDYDLQGKRLRGDMSKDIDEITADEYEPAWDIINATTGYQVKSIITKDNTALVNVIFLNSWEVSTKYSVNNIVNESVDIRLVNIGGRWKIGPPYNRPHVLPTVIRKHLENLIRDHMANSRIDKEYLSYTSQEIEAVSQYISAIK